MKTNALVLLPLILLSLSVGAKQDAQTLPLADAIVVRNTQCHYVGGVLQYEGVIKNLSNYSSYKVTLSSDFLYKKRGKKYKSWNKETKQYNFKPNKSYPFSFKARISPKSFKMKCSHDISGYFVASTLKK